MAAPQKPTVPEAPLRTEPGMFAGRAEAFMAFFATFVNFLNANNEYAEDQAQDKLAEAQQGFLGGVSLSANAGETLAVNAGGTALESVAGQSISAGAILNLADTSRTAADRGKALATRTNNQNQLTLAEIRG